MLIVDRIEGGFAVTDSTDISLNDLPSGVKEGDVLVKTENGYVIDKEKTDELREKNSAIEDLLWK